MILSGWTLKRISGPEIEPVSLQQAKRQCKVDDDITDEDPDILDWITSARELAEDYTKRTLVESTWLYAGPAFPFHGPDHRLFLPMGPLIRLVNVSYIDATGAPQTLDPSDPNQLQVAADDMPPWLYAPTWPQTNGQVNNVAIEYVAGYPVIGSPATDVDCPRKAKTAIRFLVGHFYTNRESVVAETRIAPAEMPYSFERALDTLKVYP